MCIHGTTDDVARPQLWTIIIGKRLWGARLNGPRIKLVFSDPNGKIGQTGGNEDLLTDRICDKLDRVRVKRKLSVGIVQRQSFDRDAVGFDVLVELRHIRVWKAVIGIEEPHSIASPRANSTLGACSCDTISKPGVELEVVLVADDGRWSIKLCIVSRRYSLRMLQCSHYLSQRKSQIAQERPRNQNHEPRSLKPCQMRMCVTREPSGDH